MPEIENTSIVNRSIDKIVKLSLAKKVGIILFMLILILQLSLILRFNSLPNPPYGGDIYRERGFVQYIANGNQFWTDPYFENELEFYPPLGYLIPAMFVKLGLNLEHVVYFLVLATMASISFVLYLLGKKMFNSETYGIICAFLFYAFDQFIAIKFSAYFGYLFLLLSIYFYIELSEKKDTKSKILLGICLGIASLSHYRIFIQAVVIIGAFMIVDAVKRLIKNRNKNLIFSEIKKIFNDYIISFAIALGLAMIFFLPLILRYSLKTLNETNKYSFTEPNGLSTIFEMLFSTFFNFSSFVGIVSSILLILGFILMLNNLKNEKIQLIFISLIAIVLATSHFLFTKPLFNTWIVPGHIYGGIKVASIFIMALGLKMVYLLIKKTGLKKDHLIPLILFIVIIVPTIYVNYTVYKNSKWFQYAMSDDEGTKAIYEIGDWILANTNNKDVFIGNDESLFMVNAMSGRHLTTVRRTHASPYVNVEERYADTLVMIYGKDENFRKSLIKKYNVTYMFIDTFMVSNPMIVKSDYAQYLKENGVNFTVSNVPFDPAANEGLKYESAIVYPQELMILNSSIQAKNFFVGTQLYASIYKII